VSELNSMWDTAQSYWIMLEDLCIIYLDSERFRSALVYLCEVRVLYISIHTKTVQSEGTEKKNPNNHLLRGSCPTRTGIPRYNVYCELVEAVALHGASIGTVNERTRVEYLSRCMFPVGGGD
jgi:hypothetical protein